MMVVHGEPGEVWERMRNVDGVPTADPSTKTPRVNGAIREFCVRGSNIGSRSCGDLPRTERTRSVPAAPAV